MITDHFPELSQVIERLSPKVDEALELRRSLGLDVPSSATLNFIVDSCTVGGNASHREEDMLVNLNVIQEITNNNELKLKYKSELEDISKWVERTKAIIPNPGHASDTSEKLLSILVDPDLFDESQLYSDLSPESMQNHIQIMHNLKKQAPTIYGYLQRMVQDVAASNLEYLSLTVRHEIGHYTPSFRLAIEEHDKLDREIISDLKAYVGGSRHIPEEDIYKKIETFLGRAAIIFSEDEARAHFFETYSPEDTIESISKRRDVIEWKLVNCYMHTYREMIFKKVVNQLEVEYISKGQEFDDNSARYASSIIFQGAWPAKECWVEPKKLDSELIDSIFSRAGYWENQFKVGIKYALDKAEAFYQQKIAK